MKWKLRIPLILFIIGFTSGIVQYFQLNLGMFYLLIIGLVIYFLEKTGINEKTVHFSMGVLFIVAGILIDYLLK